MITEAARLITALAGAWLMVAGLVMAVRPQAALKALAGFASTPLLHFGEIALRTLAGAGLVLAADRSAAPWVLTTVGWFLVVSSAALLVTPRRLHAAFSTWWARRIPPLAVRLLSVPAAAAGAWLIRTVA